MSTAKIAKAMDGGKLYQKRARQALPLLVRQVEAGKTITYSALAAEMGNLIEVRVFLVLGGEVPDSLIPLRNMFAIDVSFPLRLRPPTSFCKPYRLPRSGGCGILHA